MSRLRPLSKPRPPASQPATLSEVHADRAVDAAAVAFVLAHLDAEKPLLWIQDRLSRKETGRPCLAGLPRPFRILHVDVSRPVDVLWAMEEGLRCRALGGVLGEVWGDPQALDFTATKRLALRSEAQNVPAWLIRRAAQAGLSAARDRWRLRSLPALRHPDDARAPGDPMWRAERFRSRWDKTGTWVARLEEGALRLDLGMESQSLPAAQALS